MKKDILLLFLFFAVVVSVFTAVTLSAAKVFVSSVNSITASYYPEGNDGVKE
jgi:hypothetical protein